MLESGRGTEGGSGAFVFDTPSAAEQGESGHVHMSTGSSVPGGSGEITMKTGEACGVGTTQTVLWRTVLDVRFPSFHTLSDDFSPKPSPNL